MAQRGRPRKNPIIEPSQSVNSSFFAEAKIAGRIYKAEGATLEEAVSNLNPDIKKGYCLLTIRHGKSTIIKILKGTMTHNLFNKYVSRISREVAYKNLKTLFS